MEWNVWNGIDGDMMECESSGLNEWNGMNRMEWNEWNE